MNGFRGWTRRETRDLKRTFGREVENFSECRSFVLNAHRNDLARIDEMIEPSVDNVRRLEWNKVQTVLIHYRAEDVVLGTPWARINSITNDFI